VARPGAAPNWFDEGRGAKHRACTPASGTAMAEGAELPEARGRTTRRPGERWAPPPDGWRRDVATKIRDHGGARRRRIRRSLAGGDSARRRKSMLWRPATNRERALLVLGAAANGFLGCGLPPPGCAASSSSGVRQRAPRGWAADCHLEGVVTSAPPVPRGSRRPRRGAVESRALRRAAGGQGVPRHSDTRRAGLLSRSV